MNKVKIISPKEISSYMTDSLIKIGVLVGDFTIGTSGTITIEISDTKDFVSKDIVNVSNNSVTNKNTNSVITLDYKQPTRVCKYLRVCITENGTRFLSNTILISTLTGLEIIFDKKDINFSPKFITFNDYFELCNDENSLEFNVNICNNANDKFPVWEDCTASYINKTPYRFTNSICITGDWSVGVRITGKKIKENGCFKLYRISHIIN